MPKLEILNEGNPECEHRHVEYISNAFDGQAFWCDDCPRHERLPYSPGEKIRFPSRAFIRTPNPQHGDSETYSHQADEKGIVRGILSPEKRFKRTA